MALPQHSRPPVPDLRDEAIDATSTTDDGRSMLVLTRKPGEAFRIGNDVVLVVINTEGHQTKIGIQAPRDVSIMRGELLGKPGKGAASR